MPPARRRSLARDMTFTEFDNGYWYAEDLRRFAISVGIPAAARLRKDELEHAIKHLLRTGEMKESETRAPARSTAKDIDRGLSLDLPVVNYTSNKQTKQFIEGEARKIEPGFKRASGTRYLLNRWREAQLAAGKPITYRDLVMQAIALNRSKTGPLRLKHGRYMNFVADFRGADKAATHAQIVDAWHELKEMDVPKTYAAWVKAHRKPR